jgi:hypothetical protein
MARSMRTELDRPKVPIMNESGDAGRDGSTRVLRARGLRDGAFVDETRLTGGTTGHLGALAGLEG